MATGRVPTTANSPLTAKGDLFGYSTTQARVAVGNDGETLVADSSTSTGLRYQEPKASNPVLNSAFQIWQRGTSISVAASTANAYTADRWAVVTGASVASTISRQVTNDTTNLPNIQYCGRFQRNSGQTGTSIMYISNSFESVNSIPFVGKTVTFSFYARKGADYSAASSILVSKVYSGTGTDQQSNTGYTGASAFINQNNTLTTTWQRFTATGTISTSATELSIELSWTPVGTASTNDYFEVTGVQLEVGSVATPFKTYAGTIQGELAACQRYYQKINNDSITSYLGFMGTAYSATGALFAILPKTSMRIKPTSVDFSNIRVFDGSNAATSISAITLGAGSTDGFSIDVTASSMTQYRPYFIIAGNPTAGSLGFSAEL
jgi:hypothetical protein